MYKLTARNANAFGSAFAFLAHTQSPTKTQKSYQGNAQGTYSATLDTVFCLTQCDEVRTHKLGFGKYGLTLVIFNFSFSIIISTGLDVIKICRL